MSSSRSDRVAILGKPLADAAMAMAEEAGVQVSASGAYLQGEDLHEFLSSCRPDAIILRLGSVDDAAMAAAPDLKIIAKHGVGFDTIDLVAANRRGIVVSIATGANAISVAEHALALMLAVCRGIAHLDARMRVGHWDKATYLGTELAGKALGIVGVGAIGHHLAKICRGLGMRIVVFDPAISYRAEGNLWHVESLEELLETSDIVSLHCPLTKTTRNMISDRQFALMKPNSILINTARGGLVDHEALLKALDTGSIAGAGIDTFPEEPPLLSDQMRSSARIVLSPHVGASTVEAGVRVGTMAMGQVLDCLAGKPIDKRCVVNKPSVEQSG